MQIRIQPLPLNKRFPLTISRGTAKNHVEHIIQKLGVSDRTQAVVRALELGILDLSE